MGFQKEPRSLQEASGCPVKDMGILAKFELRKKP